MYTFIGKSNEQILFQLNKSETVKTSNFTCQSKSFISIFFTFQVSACKLLPFSCHDLANDTYSRTANWKLCSATLTSALKRTVTGPDQIPYWVWKEHTEISRFLSPKSGISQSLLSVCHHRGSKQLSNPPPPLPKVDVPKAHGDYCGVNIPPVQPDSCYSKGFWENCVALPCLWDHWKPPQHLTVCLQKRWKLYRFSLCYQFNIGSTATFMDNPDFIAVHLFAMDFSKAFDSVKHELFANKLKKLPLNPYMYITKKLVLELFKG